MPRPGLSALLVTLIITLLLLGGCTLTSHKPLQVPTTKNAQSNLQWQSHQAQMEAFTQWRLVGKIGIRTEHESSSAHINWQQQRQQFRINLSGPFGQGAAELSGTFESVLLKIAGQEDLQTTNPEAVLLEQTGWDIPINTLLHWIKGIPSPDQDASFQLDAQGRLSRLTQAQWQLEYPSYRQFESLWLPKKIQLVRGQVKLTLVIKDWHYSSDNS